MNISVVIPTSNGFKTIQKCVDSVVGQSFKPFEIVIADNGSSKKTAKILDSFPKTIKQIKIKVIKAGKNLGVTGGRNLGIQNVSSKSELVVFIDHDIICDKQMIRNLVKTARLKKNYGIITPKIYYWGDKNLIWSAGTNINLLTGQVLFRGGEDVGQFDKIEKVQVAPSVLLVKKELLDKIYGFDDKYYATYEDTDFCFRARKKGYFTVYSPKSIAYHILSTDKKNDRKRLLSRAFWVGRNRVLFMGDFGENFYLFLLISPIYLIYFVFLSWKEKDLSGLKNYLNGYVAGIIEEVFAKRLLVDLPFSIFKSYQKAIGSDSKTVLDVGCGDGRFLSILNKNKIWKITGVDIYEPDLQKARETGSYVNLINADVNNIDKVVKNAKFDAISCTNVLEHVPKKKALKLITKFEKIAKRIVIVVPRGFLEKEEPYYFEGNNPYQLHKSAWSIDEFEERGYVVRGIGVNFLLGDRRLSSNKIFNNKPFSYFKFLVVLLENFLAYLFAPLSYYFPTFSTGILAVKNVRLNR